MKKILEIIDFLILSIFKYYFYLFIFISISCNGQTNDKSNTNIEFFCYEFDSFISQLNLKNLKDKNEDGELSFRIWALNSSSDSNIFIADIISKGNSFFLKQVFLHITDTSFCKSPILNNNFIIDSTRESELPSKRFHNIKKEITLVMNHSLFAKNSLPKIANIIGFYFEFSDRNFYKRLHYQPCSDFKFGLPIQSLVNKLLLSLTISKEIEKLDLLNSADDCIPIEAEATKF